MSDKFEKRFLGEEAYSTILYYYTWALALLNVQTVAAEEASRAFPNTTVYGDARIASSTALYLAYIEGTFGALVMVSSFLFSLIFLALGFFKKKKKWFYVSIVFFILSVFAFILRDLVSVFFSEGSMEPY